MNVVSHALFIPTEEAMKELTLPASLKRRAPRIWKIAYGAVAKALENVPFQPEAIVCGTALGALDETIQFLKKIYTANMGSPRQFIASVHNSMAGVLAMEFNVTGSNMTLCESHNSLAAALNTAGLLPESKVLVVVVDEQLEFLESVYENCPNAEAYIGAVQEGALALLLDTSSAELPQITASVPKPSVEKENIPGSFMAPAITLEEALTSNSNISIKSFSPTSNCEATVNLLYE